VSVGRQELFGLRAIDAGKPRSSDAAEEAPRCTQCGRVSSWSRRMPELRRDHQAAEADRVLLLEARAPRRSQLRVVVGGDAA
jgi:hypothetical protein